MDKTPPTPKPKSFTLNDAFNHMTGHSEHYKILFRRLHEAKPERFAYDEELESFTDKFTKRTINQCLTSAYHLERESWLFKLLNDTEVTNVNLGALGVDWQISVLFAIVKWFESGIKNYYQHTMDEEQSNGEPIDANSSNSDENPALAAMEDHITLHVVESPGRQMLEGLDKTLTELEAMDLP